MDDQLVEAVRDLSDDDPKAVEVAWRVLRDGPPPDSMFHSPPEPGQAAPKPTRYDLLAASLEEAGRLVSLDWKEDVAEARAWFISLFETAGVGGAEAVELVPRPGESDVDTAHRTFAAFAASHDLRIVTLDADSDMHHFALTTSDRADRWNGVRIGPNQFIGEGRE